MSPDTVNIAASARRKLSNVEDIYPLSPIQQGMLFHTLYEGKSGAYFSQMVCRMAGALNVHAFRSAWQEVVRRHAVLRTAFFWEGLSQPVQIVRRQVELQWHEEDWRELGDAEQEARWRQYLEEDREKGFDLTSAPLLRFAVIRTAEECHCFVLSRHHIILDGWCQQIVMREVAGFYEAFRKGKKFQPEKPSSYSEYVRWLQKQDDSKAEAFWRAELEGFSSPTRIDIDKKRLEEGEAGVAHAQSRISLTQDTAGKLEEMSRAHKMTLNAIIQGAWGVLLSKYSGETDVLFGATVSGRSVPVPGIGTMLGVFINTLPVRVQVRSTVTIIEFLKNLQNSQLNAREHEYVSIQKVQGWADVPRGTALFDYIMVFQRFSPDSSAVEPADASLKAEEVHDYGAASYPLTLTIVPGKELICSCDFDCRRFYLEDIDRMLGHLQELLAGIAVFPRRQVGDLSLLSQRERDQVLFDWNRTQVPYQSRCIHELFEEQADRTPEAPAVEHEEEALSYAALNRRANQLAYHLRESGVGPEVFVGLYLEQSLEVPVAVLAVLKAGGVYVPLEPAHPAERIAKILKDTRASIVLTDKQHVHMVPRSSATVLTIDDGAFSLNPSGNPVTDVLPDNAAYVLYTSGSTGDPKGVCVEHRQLTNYVQAILSRTAASRFNFAMVQPLSVDSSLTALFSPLMTGGSVFLVSRERVLDASYMAQFFQQRDVDCLKIAPSHLAALQAALPEERIMPERVLVIGGEASRWNWVKTLQEKYSGCAIFNHYGPTETTVGVLTYPVTGAAPQGGDSTIPLGKPLANTQVYVLDKTLHPVPVGIAGEIYIGGRNVARGYLNQPSLTAEHFVPDPWGEEGGRLYRTGDRARYSGSGDLEFLGRLDNQIKMHGFRIEPGEIQAALLRQENVREAEVVFQADETGKQHLVAYIVPKPGVIVNAGTLKAALRKQVPDYMVPAGLMVLQELPRTLHGKLDRKALPLIERLSHKTATKYIGPSNPVEKTLHDIWTKFLRLKQISVYDNFFELGGDSIISIQVVGHARQAGLLLTPRQIFEFPTIAALAEIASTAKNTTPDDDSISGWAPLSPIQSAFFQHWGLEDLKHYNQSVLLELPGDADSALLETTVRALLQQHDALRMKYVLDEQNQDWRQWCEEEIGDDGWYARKDLSSIPPDEQALELGRHAMVVQSSLNLQLGQIFRAVEYELGVTKRLLIVIHHLAIDGVSWRILLEDLELGFKQLKQGKAINLGAKTTSFKSWSERLHGYRKEMQLTRELEYWCAEERERVSSAPLDYEGQMSQNLVDSENSVVIELSEDLTRELLQDVPRVYHTRMDDVLLAALAQACVEWIGSDSLLLNMEGHGRELIFPDVDVSRTVGWFTTHYPVLLKCPNRESCDSGQLLKSIKEQLRRVPSRGIGYGILRYLENDHISKKLAEMPQAEISFNYLGQFDQSFERSELFGLARESHGREVGARNLRQNVLSVTAMIVMGKLRIAWLYSDKLHRRDTIVALSERHRDCLHKIIEHCCDKDAGGVTPSDFPLSPLSQIELDHLIGKGEEVEDIYPLSPMQQGILLHSQYQFKPGIYYIQMACSIEGHLDVPAFERAWDTVIQRHAVLRSRFIWEAAVEPVQVVHKSVSVPWQKEDWRDIASDEQHRRWQDFLVEDRNRRFAFDQAPLIRLTLIRIAPEKYYFAWTSHHLLLDGWCRQIVVGEVFALYRAFAEKNDLQLKRPRAFRDYIAWLIQQEQAKAEAFWRTELKGFDAPIQLGPTGKRNGVQEDQQHGEIRTVLQRDATEGLELLARNQQVTLNTVVQVAWAILLNRYSQRSDVVFGATISGRSAPLPGIEQTVGVFINTLPVRVHVDQQERIDACLKRHQHQQMLAHEYEYTPLLKVQSWSEVPKGTPLFENILVYENYPTDSSLAQGAGPGLQIRETQDFDINNYPLTLAVSPGAELSILCSYSHAVFDQGYIGTLMERLKMLLEQIPLAAGEFIGQLSLLNKTEQEELLVERNRTTLEFLPCCIPEIFEAQVERTPTATAVAFEGQYLSYRELNERANQLAHYLRNLGVGPEMLVEISMERSLEMVVAIMGILKAGAAYVPLDSSYPVERLAYIQADVQAPVLLTVQRLAHRLPVSSEIVICLDTECEEIALHPATNPRPLLVPDNLAYVIFTSGSTGKPKGVCVTHGGARNLAAAQIKAFSVKHDSAVLQFASLNFDASAWEWLMALLSGARLVLANEQSLLPGPELIDLLERESITIATLPPSVLAAVPYVDLPKLQDLIVAGEACTTALVEKWAVGRKMWNAYGPTEVTVCATISAPLSPGGGVSIGNPIANTQVYVLDKNLELALPDLPGELCVGGAGLARGYLNRPELTAERFIPDPFSQSRPGSRLYRTGDLVRWVDGSLEFSGRVDQQVKVRGYRIELEEIKETLAQHPGIQACTAIVREDEPGDKRLVAYVVLNSDQAASKNELRAFLQSKLPEYMIPSAFVVLDELPLTPNGKIDTKRLSRPAQAEARIEMLPWDELELRLAGIWEEVLNVSSVARDQSFFELGGDSLIAVKVLRKINEQFCQNAPLSVIFEHPTIEQLGRVLRQQYRSSQRSNLVPIHPHGSKRPIFFIHPGGGGALGYKHLAGCLGTDQPFYGFQALDDEEVNREVALSIEERAAQYINNLREVQPQGPYILGGWSFGAYVAYEMAQQLRQQGDTVAPLLLLDITAQPVSNRIDNEDDAEALLRSAKEISEREFSLQPVEQKSPEERLQYLIGELRNAGLLQPEIEVSQVRNFLRGTRRRVESVLNYKLQPYPGIITLIRVKDVESRLEGTDIDPDDQTLGFARLCAQPVQVHFVDRATHHNLVRSPHVADVARIISECLQDAEPGTDGGQNAKAIGSLAY